MRVLVTGSAGHLGEALVRTLKNLQYEVIGLDILASPFTTHVGSVVDRSYVKHCMKGIQSVFHTATLHKPHIATHSRQDFVDTNMLRAHSIYWKRLEQQVLSPLFSQVQPASLVMLLHRLLELLPRG